MAESSGWGRTLRASAEEGQPQISPIPPRRARREERGQGEDKKQLVLALSLPGFTLNPLPLFICAICEICGCLSSLFRRSAGRREANRKGVL
jgi:hypothetical protein